MIRNSRILLPFLLAGFSAPSVWAQRELTDIPKPDPQAEMAAMQLDPQIEINLFASDPMIKKPIQMNFDSDGRLWVASSEVYPQIEPGAPATDKIIVLQDTTGDGVADQSQVFADDLLIPTGVLPGDGGAYVANSTELIHLSDTDGDGRADQRRVVLSGFGTEDTHHLLHTLRWGPDGCLYMNQSIYIHSHVETPYGTRHLNGGGIWRYRPETQSLEVMCKGLVNPWGHVFDAYGQSFATDGAGVEGINYVFPGAVFMTSPGAVRHLHGLNPGSPKHCGLEVLSGTHIPADWHGDLVTNDFRGHRVCRFTVRPQGSGYNSRQQPELIVSQHVAFRPIDARMGPDGAIYIADWYNPIIQHGEVDFRDDRRDRGHGRIWRLTFKNSPLMKPTPTGELSDPALISLLESPALWLRQFARQELKTRNSDQVLQSLAQWLGEAGDDAVRLNRQFEAMWVRECLDRPDAELLQTLAGCDNEHFRAAAVRYIGLRREELPDALSWLKKAVADPNPQVRLEAVGALGEIGTAEAAAIALSALDQPLDENIDFALWSALRKSQSQWIEAIAAGSFDTQQKPERLEFAIRAAATPAVVAPIVAAIRSGGIDAARSTALLSALASAADAASLNDLLQIILDPQRKFSDADRAALIAAVVRQKETRNVMPSQGPALLKAFAETASLESDSPGEQALLKAIGLWKAAELQPIVLAAIQRAQASDSLPAVALATLGQLASEASLNKLTAIANDGQADPAWRIAAIEALVGPRPNLAAREAWELMASRDQAPWGEQAIRGTLRRKGGPGRLLQTLAGVKLPSDAARAAIHEVRAAGNHPTLEDAIREAGKLDDASWKMSAELTQQLTAAVHESGDPAKGEAIFRRSELQCIACHAIGPAGGRVGPNFVSLGGSAQIDYLIESLIDPNAKVKENFHSVVVVVEDGTIVQGIRESETDESLTVRLADGSKKTIPQDTIDQVGEGRSLMAAGLVDSLTRDELVHLVSFLSELGRTPAYTITTEPIVRSWQKLVYSPEANHLLNRTSVDSVATDNPVLVWENTTTQVDGRVPVAELPKFKQHHTAPPTSFIRFDFESFDDKPIRIALPETDALKMWVDGKPTPTWNAAELKLGKGKHRVTLAVRRDAISEPFAVKIDSETPVAILDHF
ncbi:PVC-type heme-binding CxxCH protein [Rosistilla oblonga]|uniref:PVC-type heme-binding CxxCH protein n=1 Tax=Rosistilla oblonga TaxID=2527990 RepID=UPI003A970727